MTAIRSVAPPPALQTLAGPVAPETAAGAPAGVATAQSAQSTVAEARAMLAALLQQTLAATAPRQDGLAPLMADAEAMLARPEAALPQNVKDALRDLLAARLPADGIDSGKVRQALRQSGVFLESGLARGQPVGGDLKAVLLGLRAALRAWTASPGLDAIPRTPVPPVGVTHGGTASAPPSPQTGPAGSGAQAGPDGEALKADPGATPMRGPATRSQPSPPSSAGAMPAAVGGGARPVPSPSPLPGSSVPAFLQTPLPGPASASGLPAGDMPAATGGGLKTLLPTLRQGPESGSDAKPSDAPARPASVPPPHRHAPTVPQPPARPGVLDAMPPREAALRLLGETEAALARHTLLQIAALPDDISQNRAGDPAQRLVFDIPLATPQGTAVMQLRIERDGGRSGKDAKKPVWQATFSLDVEPIGAVHARIAITGDTANVSLFAERGDSAAALRENAGLLAAGLAEAAITPGDILCATGAPASPAAAPGLFVDRAS